MSTILQRSRTQRGAAYLDTGSGEVVLLLHGVGLRLEAWEPQIKALSTAYRVVVPDLPGHGESEPLAHGATLDDFVDWALALLDDLKVDVANVAGHSMGALIAGGMVATAPQRVLRVAVISGVFKRSPEARAAVMERARKFALGRIDPDKPLQRWFSDDERDSDAYRLTRQWLSLVNPEGYAAAYEAFAHEDSRYANDWSHVECPALFLTGMRDRNSTPDMARAMGAQAPRGEVRLVEGHRHMVTLTAPEQVNAELQQWLSRQESVVS